MLVSAHPHGKDKEMEPASPPFPVSKSPLIFISYGENDVGLAEAFADLLSKTSLDLLKSFYARRDIEYGGDLYHVIHDNLGKMDEMICLLTPYGYQRSWVMYEAGFAKGRNVRVSGVKFGFAGETLTGPFSQLKNCLSTTEELTGLIQQMMTRHIPASKPQQKMIEHAVKDFQTRVQDVLKAQSSLKPIGPPLEETKSSASLVEELRSMIRAMPVQMESKLSEVLQRDGERMRVPVDSIEATATSLRMDDRDPVGLLILSSVVREKLPWLYELGVDAYFSVSSGDQQRAAAALGRIGRIVQFLQEGSFLDESGQSSTQIMAVLEALSLHISELQRQF